MRYYHDPVFPVRLALITTESEYIRTVGVHKAEDYPFPSPGCAMTMLVGTTKSSGILIFVVIDDLATGEGCTEFEKMLTLVHEAVHVKQYALGELGETGVGAETEAYLIGAYTKYLCTELVYRRDKRAAQRKKTLLAKRKAKENVNQS